MAMKTTLRLVVQAAALVLAASLVGLCWPVMVS
jgi:hypothetical protein